MQMDEEVGKLASATPVMICEWGGLPPGAILSGFSSLGLLSTAPL